MNLIKLKKILLFMGTSEGKQTLLAGNLVLIQVIIKNDMIGGEGKSGGRVVEESSHVLAILTNHLSPLPCIVERAMIAMATVN